jgi:signal transduction histidine kinase
MLSAIAEADEPIQITWVQSADEALVQLRQTAFTVVLLGLPLTQTIGDGLNNLRQLRQIRLDVPIIALVEPEMMGLGIQAVEFGAYAYFPRHQLTPAMLRRLLDKAIARRDVLQEAQAEGLLTRVVLDSLPAHVAIINSAGEITAVNQEWLNLAATTQNPLITQAGPGVDLPGLCRQLENEAVAQGLEDVLTRHKLKFTLEYPWQEADRLVWHMVCITPLRWPQGGAVLTCQEITDVVTRQIQTSTYEIELADLKSQFITTVHELRTPLTAVTLYLDLINRVHKEKQQHYLSVIKQEVLRMKQHVNDVLTLARLGEPESQQHFMPVNLADLVKGVVDIQQPIAAAKGLTLTLTVDGGAFVLNGRPRQLSRVITNLVANAIRYTPTGRVQVNLEQDSANNRIGLRLADSGIGIAPEILPHIFEPFFRSPRAQQTSDTGTGLGLSIVQRIIHNHGGSISVTSEIGKGSVFQVWLPLADR